MRNNLDGDVTKSYRMNMQYARMCSVYVGTWQHLKNIPQTHWRLYFIQVKVMRLATAKGCTPLI